MNKLENGLEYIYTEQVQPLLCSDFRGGTLRSRGKLPSILMQVVQLLQGGLRSQQNRLSRGKVLYCIVHRVGYDVAHAQVLCSAKHFVAESCWYCEASRNGKVRETSVLIC